MVQVDDFVVKMCAAHHSFLLRSAKYFRAASAIQPLQIGAG
jgi:hypothetical protein